MRFRRKRSSARVLAAIASIVLVSTLFSGTPADAAVVLTVTPATGLADGQLVHVTATGLDPGGGVDVWQCTQTFGCAYGLRTGVVADAGGNLDTEVVVHSSIYIPSPQSNEVCVAQCSIAIGPIDMAGTYTMQSITFDPLAPEVPFSISATPDRSLVDGGVVQVTATSGYFNPNDTVRFRQCHDRHSWDFCGPELGSTSTDATGAFSTAVPVYVNFDTVHWPVSCTAIGEFDCYLVAEGALWNRIFLPITFGANLVTVTSSTSTPDTPTTAAQAASVTPTFTG